MARLLSTLETELNNLVLYDTEAAAIIAWADAFSIYFTDAETATRGPIKSDGVTIAKSAMKTAMVGLSVTGAASIAAGVTAFWGAGVSLPAFWWLTCVLVTPPAALSGLVAALEASFAQNIAEGADKATCMGRIATNIHTACTGGTATFPGPVVDPVL